MKTNLSAPQILYLGLDVHKAETVIALLESDRDAEPRHYGSIATTQHALERAIRWIAKKQNIQLSDLHVCYEASGRRPKSVPSSPNAKRECNVGSVNYPGKPRPDSVTASAPCGIENSTTTKSK